MATRRIKEDNQLQNKEEVLQEGQGKQIVLLKWKVICGGITLLDKRHFGKGETFEAEEWQISEAFRDGVQLLSEPLEKVAPIRVTYHLREISSTAEEQDAEDFVPLYEIVNNLDKVLSDKPVPKDKAEEILVMLNKANS